MLPPAFPPVTTDDNCDSDVANVLTFMRFSPNVQTCSDGDGADEGSYTFTRTWTSVATDDCGNENTVTTSQDITVLDEMAPQFTSARATSANDEVVEYACGDDNQNGLNDIFDFIQLPEACDVQYARQLRQRGDLGSSLQWMPAVTCPTDDIANFCMPATVEAVENGETCDDRDPEASPPLQLPEAPSPSPSWTAAAASCRNRSRQHHAHRARSGYGWPRR